MSRLPHRPVSRALASALNIALLGYKWTISPLIHGLTGSPGACRFQPTCSEYATLALALHGPMRGSWLAARRLLRCQPFSRGGFDPVPGPQSASESRPQSPSRRSQSGAAI